MKHSRFWGPVVGAVLVAACGHEAAPPPVSPAAPVATQAVAPVATTPPVASTPADTSVQVSENIRRACGISDADAYFAFDSSRVRSHAQDVLQKVASCFSTGPLRGRSLHLVGRADPRGDSEYNMVLGDHRAWAVARTLENHGLEQSRMSVTSRGELDAQGTDEAGWAKDRRVDVMLAS